MDQSDLQQHDQFLRLFMEHEESLRLFVRSLLFDQDETREVMQDVAVVLWKKFDAEMDSISFRKWAFGVARMEVLSFRRDKARDRHSFGAEVYDVLAETIVDEADALTAERRALDDCLKKLPGRQRDLVRAAYAPGVRIGELAEQMGRTAMALYKELHRIRLALVECTQKELTRGEIR